MWFIIHYIKLLCLSWNPSCLYNVWLFFFFSFQAMLCYWFTSNAFSLLQVMFLKIPVIRDKLNIPQLIKHDATMMPKKKGFLQGFKESKWSVNNFSECLVKVLRIFFFYILPIMESGIIFQFGEFIKTITVLKFETKISDRNSVNLRLHFKCYVQKDIIRDKSYIKTSSNIF